MKAPPFLQKSTIVRSKSIQAASQVLSHVAPPMAVRLAEHLFTRPHRASRPERERDWASNARRTTVSSPRGDLAAWVWGTEGPTVLLVHGWSGRGLQLGAFAAPLVRAGHRVVAFDGPGHGSSPGRTSSLLALADGITAASAAFGPVAGIVAHSLGAPASLLALCRDRVDAQWLVLISPPARTSSLTDWFRELTGFTAAIVTRMRSRLEWRLGFRWSELEPLRLVQRVSAPLLVLHDRGDREVPFGHGEALARRHPRSELSATTDLGHRRILRDPEVVDLVLSFVTRQTRSATAEQSAPAAA